MPEQGTVDLGTLTDLCTPWAIRVAVTLRVPDHIAAGVTGVDELAAKTDCDAYALGKLLRHLARKGVLTQEAGQFGLTGTGSRLLSESERVLLDLGGIGDRYARIWPGLLEAMRTGTSVYHKVFGLPFWNDLEKHPDIADSYDAVNGPLGHPVGNMAFEIDQGWESVRTVVHLGGNIGGQLAELLRRHPHLHGTLLDFPRVVASSAEVFAAAGVQHRATATGQSFFAPLPAGGDLYLILGVLRVWSDPVALRLLCRCAAAIRSHGRLVLLDDVLADGQDDDDNNEHLLTLLVGGKHARKRSLSEFTGLARTAGLDVVAAGPQPGWPFVVECRAGAAAGTPVGSGQSRPSASTTGSDGGTPLNEQPSSTE